VKFTLDTNCIIDVVKHSSPNYAALQTLLQASKQDRAYLAAVAVTASEKPKDRTEAQHFSTFEKQLLSAGLGHLEILNPIAVLDFSFVDRCVVADDAMVAHERAIHEVLFPEFNYESRDEKWRNRKCDVQAMWCHVYYSRDVFVTNDKNFHKASKKPKLLALGARDIRNPIDAAKLL
jgi:hypothetical protein